MIREPVLVYFFDTLNDHYTYAYLVKKEKGRVYLCSILTYQLAKIIGKEKNLHEVNTMSLSKKWFLHRPETEKTFNQMLFPEIIKRNQDFVVNFIGEHFQYISRICDFLEEFNSYRCHKDFVGCCKRAWILSSHSIPDNLMQQLFNFIFDFYPEYVERQKYRLLFEKGVRLFFEYYLDNKR